MVDGLLWKIVPDCLKNGLQFSLVLGFGRVGLVPLQHGSPDMEIKWIEIWRIRRPLIFLYEVWGMLLEPVLRQTGRMSRRAILLEYEVFRRHIIAVLNQLGQQIVSVVVGINLSLLSDEKKTTLVAITHSGRHHYEG